MIIAEHFQRQRFAVVSEIRPKRPRVSDILGKVRNCSGAFRKMLTQGAGGAGSARASGE